jgi:hypothetical protein
MDEAHRHRGAGHRLTGAPASIALLGALAALACASPFDVDYDEREDFSRYRSWRFASDGGLAASGAEWSQPEQRRLRQLVIEALALRGYAYSAPREGDPVDLTLRVEAVFAERKGWVNVPRSPYFLSSHHSWTSYWIEGTDRKETTFSELSLQIEAMDAGGRVVWRGALERAVAHPERLDEAGALASLLVRLPRAGPSTSGAPKRDARPAAPTLAGDPVDLR